MEMEWKQNPDCRCGFGIPAVSEFSGGHFLFRIFWRFRIFFWIFFLAVFRISWRSQNFLAVTFPNFLRIGANAAVFKSFPTTGSGVAGGGLCQWVDGSNPTF